MSLVEKKSNDRKKKGENPFYSLGLLQQTMMINSADKIIGQQKSGYLQLVGGGVRAHPSHPTLQRPKYSL